MPSWRFDVAVSFAGPDRATVEPIVQPLKFRGAATFYDSDYTAELWGSHLTESLDEIYRTQSRFVLMFISRHYKDRLWPRLERRAALAAAFERDGVILPLRIDDTTLPGVPPTIGYVDLRETSTNQVVELLLNKLGLPSDPVAMPDWLAPLHGETTKAHLLRNVRHIAPGAGEIGLGNMPAGTGLALIREDGPWRELSQETKDRLAAFANEWNRRQANRIDKIDMWFSRSTWDSGQARYWS